MLMLLEVVKAASFFRPGPGRRSACWGAVAVAGGCSRWPMLPPIQACPLLPGGLPGENLRFFYAPSRLAYRTFTPGSRRMSPCCNLLALRRMQADNSPSINTESVA